MIKPVGRLLRLILLSITFICVTGQEALLHADGLPAEFLVTQRWRYLFASRSPLTNPAFINEENYFSARYAFASTLSEFTIHDLGLVYPIGLYQSLGASVLLQGGKQFNATDGSGIETGSLFSHSKTALMLSYANNLLAGLTLGANINGYMESFQDSISSLEIGFGVDAGLSYKLLNNPFIGTHLLGLALQNIMTVLVEPKPRSFRASLNSTYWERRIESGIDFTLKDIGVSGAEFPSPLDAAQLEWDLNVKMGLWILRIANLYGLIGWTEEELGFWGFAGGINMPSIFNGRDLSFLYQYITMPFDNSSTHTLYMRADFGKHREEIYARKMAKMANVAPNDLYIKALELYNQGKYWDAFFLFSQLFVEYPDFFKNDWVSFFIGSCQEFLDMRTTAVEAYNKTRDQYARSAAVPFSDLGLMRIHYRDGNYGAVEQQFNELNKLGVPDSIKFHGYYLMGQAEIKKGNHSKGKQLFDLVPETHPDYVFAQHSIAVSNAISDNIEAAVSNLENSIQAVVTTKAQKEIVNRSYVFIGYIFYEELTKQEGPLAKAVTALRSVPKSSFFYRDALLGLGWAALKARQWADCISAGSELVSTATSPVLKAEGALLQSYAYMMQKDYSTAANLLATASEGLENFRPPSQDELSSEQQRYDGYRSSYTDVARKAYDLATSRQSSMVIKQIDSLHSFQKEYKKKIEESLKFSDSFERASFFARNMEDIRNDVDYALAKAQKLGGQVKQGETIKELKKEEQKIDDELEKLKQQLEEETQ